VVEQKNVSCRAEVKQKCKLVEQKTSSGSSKKMQAVEQKLNKKYKMAEQKSASCRTEVKQLPWSILPIQVFF
jgi:hypothetical protein